VQKRKKKYRHRRIWIFIFALAVFLFSGYQVLEYFVDVQKSASSVNILTDLAVETVPVTSTITEVTLTELVSEETEQVEYAPIIVDFEKLKDENADIIGWIYCEGTPINYPVLQSEDNNYYLRRLSDGSYNIAGSLFLDYRCSADFTDFTSVVYGHNMKNDTMFGTLSNYREQSYYEEHPTMYLLTPEKGFRVDLFFGYVTSTDSDVYALHYTEEGKESFLTQSRELSTFTTSAECSMADSFLILSTCSYEYDNARYVLIGKLTEVVIPEHIS